MWHEEVSRYPLGPMTATTVVLAHQGGWDEMLFVLVPLLVFLTLQLLNRRKTRQQSDDAEGPQHFQQADRQWPGILQNFNPQLPRDIDEADLSAIPTLVEIGQQMAAAMDWTQILT